MYFPGISLSHRQALFMAYFIKGYSNEAIAERLNLGTRTVDFYTIDLQARLNCRSKAEMIEKVKQSIFMDYVPELIHEDDDERHVS